MQGQAAVHLPTLYLATAMSGVVATVLLLVSLGYLASGRRAVVRFSIAIALGALASAQAWAHAFAPHAALDGLAAAAAIAQAALTANATSYLYGGHLDRRVSVWLPAGVCVVVVLAYLAGLNIAGFVLLAAGIAGGYGCAAWLALRARSTVESTFRLAFGFVHAVVAGAIVVRLGEVLLLGTGGVHPPYGTTWANVLLMSVFVVKPMLTALLVLGSLYARVASRLLESSLTDEFTGTFARRHLIAEAPRMLARTRSGGARLAVMMLDLDHFKRINDTYGHPAGDQVLRHAAGRLRRGLRANSLIARYGGEEFCALVPVQNRSEAVATAERLRALLAVRPARVEDTDIAVSISVGVAVDRGNETFEAILARADERVYEAKAAGRNRVVADMG